MMPSALLRPFPYSNEAYGRLRSAISISLFVFAFLFVFRPFGLNRIDNIFPVTLGYGGITLITTLLIMLLLPAVFPNYFNEKSWTVFKEIIFSILTIIIIAAGNLFYSSAIQIASLSLSGFFNFLLFTTAIAILPVTVMILIRQNMLLKKNMRSAAILSAELAHKERMRSGLKIKIMDENARDFVEAEAGNIYYLKAAENYVEIFYDEGNELKSKLLRTTLKNAHDAIKSASQFYRCHRTFIVNLQKVKSVTGNAQGYKLIIDRCDEQIPVSRSLNKEITLRLKR